MVFIGNRELMEKQQNLLAELRKLVGRGFDFSETYMKQCAYECNRIGEQEVRYGRITKKYVYIGCRAIYTTNDEETEYGARIRKYSVYIRQGETNKIALEDLFVCDLEKIVNDIKLALWWEKDVRMKILKAEMADCQRYVDLFDKFLKK
jgi:hypothetical protein